MPPSARFLPCVGLLLGLWVGPQPTLAGQPDAAASSPRGEDPAAILRAALTIIEQNYRQPVAPELLVAAALRGMTGALDPYSEYLDARAWDEFHSRLRAEFGGVGVELVLDEGGRLTVGQTLLASPARAAGVLAGDALLRIDRRSTEGMSIGEASALLRGEAGTAVELELRRAGAARSFARRVTRRVLKTPTVRGIRRDAAGNDQYMLDAPPGVGYVHISQMASDTVPGLERALRSMDGARLAGLVLDLRECSGGYVKSGVGAADLLLERGRILSVVSRRGEETTHDAQPGAATAAPLVVLINRETASACEVLAAALQDNGRAAVVGERTFGKGYIGDLFGLGEGWGGLKITTASFQRPSGRTLDRHQAAPGSTEPGVHPDAGFEVIVEGPEYDAWFLDFIRLDAPLAPAEGPAEDRLLRRGVEALAARRHGGPAS